MLHSYEEKEFKSVAAGDLDLETEEEKENAKKQAEENKEMLDFMKETLGDKVSAVRLSTRLKTHPVCFTADGQVSLEMERVLGAMPNADGSVKAQRVLEINASHPIFEKLKSLYADDQETLKKYTNLLYHQAALMEGVAIEDPVAFANEVCSLML
jgi:molecular chaperone HtpG